MTLGREPRPLGQWQRSPGPLFPVLFLGSESFYPECTKFVGSWKVNISTDPFSFHPNGYHFWKRDTVSEAAAQYMWSKQNRMENSSHSDLLPPSLIYALDAGDPERAAARFRAPCLRGGELGDNGTMPRAQVWQVWPGAVPSSSTTPTLTPTSSASVKLYFSYPKFGLIYIYTNIYISIYIYTVILLN